MLEKVFKYWWDISKNVLMIGLLCLTTSNHVIAAGNPTITSVTLSKTVYDNQSGGNLDIDIVVNNEGLNQPIGVFIYDNNKSSVLWYTSIEKAALSNKVTWNGKDTSGKELATGNYFVTVNLFKPQSFFESFDIKEKALQIINSYETTPAIQSLTANPSTIDFKKDGLVIAYNVSGLQNKNTKLEYSISKAVKGLILVKSLPVRSDSVTISGKKEYKSNFNWDGKDNNGQTVVDGTYEITFKMYSSTGELGYVEVASKTLQFTVKSANSIGTINLPNVINTGSSSGSSSSSNNSSANPSTSSSAGSNSSSGSNPSTGQSSGSSSTTGNSAASNSVNGNASSSNTETAVLIDSPDILSCKGRGKFLYFENDEPAFDRFGVDCFLNKRALIKASVYSKEYDPKSEDNSNNLIKKISNEEWRDPKKYYFDWRGLDDFDQAASLEGYTFVIEARINDKYKPDISVQKFTIVNAPTEQTETTDQADETEETLRGTAEEENDTEKTAGEDEQQIIPSANASKCPGVNYPNDIAGLEAEEMIKKAFDECLVKGYSDGSFRPDGELTRAEATKIIVLASGNLAKQGCYDADCGSPFIDLANWQGPWVRAAWDLKFVSGVGAGRFAPDRELTRAEAAALITKAFGIPPHQGCFDADCGAGHPNDTFEDIVHNWQGPYLRALWDKGIISAAAKNRFFPDLAISRLDFLEMALEARAHK
jgi:flagellar hook assembly protein FlgD